MTTLRDAKQEILKRLLALDLDASEARRQCELIFEHATGYDTARQILNADTNLQAQETKIICDIMNKREGRIPLQYCFGQAWFMGTRFAVEPGVLIPRSDTEALVNVCHEIIASSDNVKDLRVFEVGVGSGAIAISLLKINPSLTIEACDISPVACRVASSNARECGVDDRLRIKCGDWLDHLPADIDIIVSNPPYIARRQSHTLLPEVGVHEPPEALFGSDEDGLGFYRQFAETLPKHFRNGIGVVAVEVGDGESGAVSQIFESAAFSEVRVDLDMSGAARVVTARK